MLATDSDQSATSEPTPVLPALEQWTANDVMRHIPTQAWMAQKVDHDLRRRIDRLWLPFSDLAASDPQHPAIESEFRALCHALERVAYVAMRHRGALHPPNDLGGRVHWLLNHAVQSLNSAASDTFGRRMPFHLFERSNAEPLWAAVLTVIHHVQVLADRIREIEPSIDEQMHEDLVQAREPMRRDPMA